MKRRSIATSSSYGYGAQEQEDRLSSLPDVLLIYILSYIDTRLAVQSSILSKRWVNLWTLLPVLNFDSSFFEEEQNYTLDNFTFDKFIDKVLAYRNGSIKIDNVSIKVTDHKTMARVFRYAMSHRVPNLSIDTSQNLSKYHPISCADSSDSLMSFTLKGMLNFGRFPKFSGLVSLRLERVKIIESEPFSCFPNLEKLFLVNCKLPFDLPALEVIGSRLSRLTISSCFYHPIPYEKLVLLTPKLVLLELDGLIPMSFEASELPFLDTVHIDCCFSFPRVASAHQPDESQQKLNLINILRCLGNAKSVHLSPSTVKLLDLSHGMLVEETCPFGNLKFLNLIPPPNKPVELLPHVEAYLLKDCPRAVVTTLPR
ncbi:putative F-box/FBD/LRR-repeat protein At4g03220 [Cynara cardunculus var. scolymus]|uniref:F-box domain, cyclin-like protein n=1 Tax=Cynara cardunculus var. scolymus TaxID=59895 RepID=A0A103YIF0_CYNCS|nr:putative F-box/FBD/LRR-repeat protein At4g03220 [Cynara cardunculus var. scolymus]KVI09669.1 F-box domain, cyclin-like protein [Cynara cardunculus var. scolymus]